MIVVHIESGLGNQMLSYCEYLALKMMNPNEEIYIENITYDIDMCNDIICQWNGYELDKIFGIDAPNINSVLSNTQWEKFRNLVIASRFWDKNWNYPVYISKALTECGYPVQNYRGDFEKKNAPLMIGESKSVKSRFRHTYVGFWLKRMINMVFRDQMMLQCNCQDLLFVKTEESIFTGQRLAFKFKGNGIEIIEPEIRNVFRFPMHDNITNINFEKLIISTNSVAIHARRGDMLGYNYDCYKHGYFKRAIRFIKKHVSDPVFIIFCDPGSVGWCKQNQEIFGLDFNNDIVYFVDWNKGTDSYRDMQLMSECKHQVITNSSFGWWAAFLNKNEDKITCSPDFRINTTHHF